MTERPGNSRRFTPVLACSVLLLSALAAFATPAAAAIPDTERQALVALYDQTGGPSWTTSNGWLGPMGTECSWYGVQCDAAGTHVIGLNLLGNRLTGPIPSGLAAMSELSSLELAFNQLSGVIPVEIAQLTQLAVLHLNMNRLTGSVPPQLGLLSNLQSLTLQMNDLNGPIPPGLGNLANLSELSLANNRLSGSIPAELGALTSLNKLYLDWNQLGGTLPAELNQLVNLSELRLGGNRFEGEIPDLSALMSLSLFSMQYSSMLAPAPVPESLRALSQLSHLDLAGTNRTGAIPGWLDSLTNLQYLGLSGNSFSGDIPSLANLKGLFTLDLRINRGLNAGPVPDWLQANTALYTLMLGATNRTGGIPPWIAQLPWLYQLDLGDNDLSGGIPAELGSSSVSVLMLGSNRLSGPIPRELMNLRSAYYVLLNYNALFSEDADLTAFLDALAPGWQGTQTVAPASVAVAGVGVTTVTLEWEPIAYAADSGRYLVFATTDGASNLVGQTASKTATSLTVENLKPGTTYSFVVKTVTDPHAYNANLITSGPSVDVTATTVSGHVLTVSQQGSGSGRITSTPAGIDCGAACSFGFARRDGRDPDRDPRPRHLRWMVGCLYGDGTVPGDDGQRRDGVGDLRTAGNGQPDRQQDRVRRGHCRVLAGGDRLRGDVRCPVRPRIVRHADRQPGAGRSHRRLDRLRSGVRQHVLPQPQWGPGRLGGFHSGGEDHGDDHGRRHPRRALQCECLGLRRQLSMGGRGGDRSVRRVRHRSARPGDVSRPDLEHERLRQPDAEQRHRRCWSPAAVDFALAPGGKISGKVTDAATGLPLSSVQVTVVDANGASVTSSLTNSSGNWITSRPRSRRRTECRPGTTPATSIRPERASPSWRGRRPAGSISPC